MTLSKKQYFALASMIFGLFFGAGNLIFPAFMGQMAGSKTPIAILGFLITAVGLPLLGLVAIGISHSEGLLDMSSRVSKKYGLFLTCLLYLTIGPLFAIPRTATVSFSVGIEAMAPNSNSVWLLVFSLVFFLITLFFSLYPTKILTWVGRIINPLFLIFLGVILITAIFNPMGSISSLEPIDSYASQSFFTGFLEGYNTLDVLAGVAFGIVIVNVIRDLGITEPKEIAKTSIKSGIIGFVLMAIIYIGIALVGAQSRNTVELAENGGIILSQISRHYFGNFGGILLAATVILACLKTAIGLITSCGEAFNKIFPKVSYKAWAIIFCILSFIIANFGLNSIITWSLPVLRFLYPLTITLIFLNIFGSKFEYSKDVMQWTTALTIPAAILDFINAFPKDTISALHLQSFLEFFHSYLPFFNIGLGWIIPSTIGFIIGLIIYNAKKKKATV